MDMHVHSRASWHLNTRKRSVAGPGSGSRRDSDAACMANTKPVADCAAVIVQIKARAGRGPRAYTPLAR